MAYWLDSGVLIQAARGPYRFKMIPQFWQYLQTQFESGVIQMTRLAYEEIVGEGYDDDLEHWCRARKKFGLCKNETKVVQERYGQITTFLVNDPKYQRKPQLVREFTTGADGWTIAYALSTQPKGIVVTEEIERSAKGKIKVPAVAKVFDVKCLSLSQMLAILDPDLSGK
jgi:hypothetical protein